MKVSINDALEVGRRQGGLGVLRTGVVVELEETEAAVLARDLLRHEQLHALQACDTTSEDVDSRVKAIAWTPLAECKPCTGLRPTGTAASVPCNSTLDAPFVAALTCASSSSLAIVLGRLPRYSRFFDCDGSTRICTAHTRAESTEM